jgi:3-hydroxy-9,10-secoandrosta-1,3,5(10)-triene-9,17-dione monooxygenase
MTPGSRILAPTPLLTREAVVERARELFPVLREQARRADDERHLTPEMVEAFAGSELVRAHVPERWGGWELDFHTALDVVIELGRAAGAIGWVGSFWIDHAYWLSLFPEEAQRAVWADGPDTRISTSFVPVGQVSRAQGGWLLSGDWSWASGVGYAQWVLLGGLVHDDGGPPQYRLFLLPTSTVTVVDTWYSAGLRGSGSDNVVADGVFVPEEHSVVMELLREGRSPGSLVNRNPIYAVPLMAVGGIAMVGPAIGIARGVLEAWQDGARAKVHSYTQEQVAAALPMQIGLAEAAALIDTAELVVRGVIDRVEAADPVTLELRVRNRRDLTFAMRMLGQAVDGLMQTAGASGLRDESPIQRGWRDVRAIACHVILNFNATAENYGRMALGLPLNPRDPFV